MSCECVGVMGNSQDSRKDFMGRAIGPGTLEPTITLQKGIGRQVGGQSRTSWRDGSL